MALFQTTRLRHWAESGRRSRFTGSLYSTRVLGAGRNGIIKKRQKRLVTSVIALIVMLLALVATSGDAVVPSSQEYCRNAGGCANSCGGDECEDIGECDTWCEEGICSSKKYWVGCEPEH